MNDVDVLVIGSGVAGLSAAVSARESGAERVLVLEAERVVGGSTRLSTGIVMGAGSRAQRLEGIIDDGVAYYNDYMNANAWCLPGGVIQALTAASGETIDWLEDHGVEYHPGMIHGGSENTPRCVAVVGGGQGLINALHRSARDADIDIVLDQRVTRLLVSGGRVAGAAVGGEEITAGAVIVATGGIGANRKRLEQLFPDQMGTAGSWHWYIGSDGARGDHLEFADQVGADVVGVMGLRLLHSGFVQTLESYIPGWQVLVNSDGRRFVDESAPYGILDRTTSVQGDRAFFIFDRQGVDDELTGQSAYRQTYPEDPDRRSPNWNPAMITEQVEHGRIARGNTVEEVAAALGLDPVALADTVRQYNDGVTEGVDRFGKAASFLRPLVHAPFYGAEVRLATLCWTGTGLSINHRAQVLDQRGNVIAGLYAAGESSGGPMGEVYVGSGGSIANGAIFGRIAGREASRGSTMLDDHAFAAWAAERAGDVLLRVRAESGLEGAALKDAGDAAAQELLAGLLAEHRPNDAVLSEEATDDKARLSADRVWIIDPLDGTREFSEPPRDDWAVHVALWEASAGGDGLTAGAVAQPALGETFSTAAPKVVAPRTSARPRIAVSRSRPPAFVEALAVAINAELVPMGSAGVKVMSVVRDLADAYVHAGGQYQWDNAAPVAVARSAGLHCSRVDGSPLVYNADDTSLPDLIVCRPELAEQIIEFVQRHGTA